jgi:hypothetical protein
MDQTGLVFPRGNDVVVTARFPDISDPTGMTSEFFSKPSRDTPDDDPAVQVYDADVDNDPANPGATWAQFTIPADDTGITGTYWWRVDCIDTIGNRRTAECGPLFVEAV